jgi:hypothetical protein
MKSLTQEIMELQDQLRCIQNVKEEWKDDECIKQIAEAVKNTKTNLSKAFGGSTTIIASMSDDQVQEKDPITTLYPFAAVACGEDGDLERSFELLRRQPGVLDRNPVQSNSKRTKTRKRSIAS